MAAVHPVDSVLLVCGFTANEIVLLRQYERLNDLEAFTVMDRDEDITEMAKRMGNVRPAGNRVHMPTVLIKNLQTLCWWASDRTKRNLPLDADLFDADELRTAREAKRIQATQSTGTESTADLLKFNPDTFEACDEAFVTFLQQVIGAVKEPLAYVVREDVMPVGANAATQRMYELPHQGATYTTDNTRVHTLLKSYLADTPGYEWIREFDATQDGRAAYLALRAHYNGEGELRKRTTLATETLRTAHYKNEQVFSFEKYSETLTKAFATLDKDPDERLSERQKVTKLVDGINVSDGTLVAAKQYVMAQFPANFSGAVSHFGSMVVRVHGPAVLAAQNRGGSRRRRVSAAGRVGGRGRGGGRGNGGNNRGGRGRGGRGNRGNGRNNGNGNGRNGGGRGGRGLIVNGVDITDPNPDLTTEQMDQLGTQGRAILYHQRDYFNDRNGNRSGRGNGGGNSRNVGSVEADSGGDSTTGNNTGNGDRGANNGNNFGRNNSRGTNNGGNSGGNNGN